MAVYAHAKYAFLRHVLQSVLSNFGENTVRSLFRLTRSQKNTWLTKPNSGYNNTITLVLTSPPYIFSALFSLALARSSGYFNDRTWHIVGGNLFAIVGFVLACATTGLAPRYAACFLFAAGSYSTGSIILGWASANVADSHEKKAVTLAMVNFSAVAANVYTAYLWPDSDSPRFIIGLGSSVGFSFVCGLVAIVAWYLFRRSNSKRLGEASGDNVKLYAI